MYHVPCSLWMLLLATPCNALATRPPSSADVHIGISSAFFPELSEDSTATISELFGLLVDSHAPGDSGAKVTIDDPIRLGESLSKGQIQLAVFNGVEYGWAKREHPKIDPLLLAVNKEVDLQALLVTYTESDIRVFEGTKNKSLAVSKKMRHHCTLFLSRQCQGEPENFFKKIQTADNAERALDQVFDRTMDCALVDKLAFEEYQRRKPARHAKLRVVESSPNFPAAVVAVNFSALQKDRTDALKHALLRCKETMQGQHVMTFFRFTAFERVPEGYEHRFSMIAEHYPPDPKAEVTGAKRPLK